MRPRTWAQRSQDYAQIRNRSRAHSAASARNCRQIRHRTAARAVAHALPRSFGVTEQERLYPLPPDTPVAAQDEWGLFDPELAGLPAVRRLLRERAAPGGLDAVRPARPAARGDDPPGR